MVTPRSSRTSPGPRPAPTPGHDPPPAPPGPIQRRARVERHNPTLKANDPLSPLSVGNGEFAFTADITGLQTFDDFHRDGIHLCTMSQWGWHSDPPYQD